MRVVGVVAHDLGSLGRFEDAYVLPSSPRVGKGRLLDVQLTREAIGAMNDQTLGRAVVDRHQRGSQPRSLLDTEATAQGVVLEHDNHLMAVLGSPGAAGVLLGLQRVGARAVGGRCPAVGDQLHTYQRQYGPGYALWIPSNPSSHRPWCCWGSRRRIDSDFEPSQMTRWCPRRGTGWGNLRAGLIGSERKTNDLQGFWLPSPARSRLATD